MNVLIGYLLIGIVIAHLAIIWHELITMILRKCGLTRRSGLIHKSVRAVFRINPPDDFGEWRFWQEIKKEHGGNR